MKNLKTLLFLFFLVQNNIYSQISNETKMTNQQIVETFLNGFNDKTKLKQSLDLLSEDYIFSNPLITIKSKSEFIGLAKQIGDVIKSIEIKMISNNEDDWVATFYEFTTDIQGLESTLGSEWFKLKNGKIIESHLIYDTFDWRKIYAEINNN